MDRREYLAVVGLGAAGAVAGCTGSSETDAASGSRDESERDGADGGSTDGDSSDSDDAAPPTVENRPDAVYVPTHVDGMEMAGTAEIGRLRIGLSYTYPHQFWLLDGASTNPVGVTEEDTMHLMTTIWDAETGIAFPSSNAMLEVSKDGAPITAKRMWPMLSQRMGFHYGDNVRLDGDGEYEVEVDVGSVSTRTTGGFSGAFEDGGSGTIGFEFASSTLEELTYRPLEDRMGERDAVDPMEMEMLPTSTLPEASALPGTALGEASIADATLVGTLLETPPDGIDKDGAYLAISPRTPYNRYPLPFMALSATVGDGQSDDLTETLDPELGYHYGAVVGDATPDDEVAVTVETVPQVARHEGYETAFLETGTATLGGE